MTSVPGGDRGVARSEVVVLCWVQMQGYTTPEQKDTFNLMGFNSSSTPSTATNIDLGSLPVSFP